MSWSEVDQDGEIRRLASQAGCGQVEAGVETEWREQKQVGSTKIRPNAFEVLYGVALDQEDEQEIGEEQTALRRAKELKAEGNEEYTSGRTAKALERYRKAMLHLFQTKAGKDKEKLKDEILLPLLLNCAQCQLKLEEYRSCVWYATRALAIDSTNQKALFRRASALIKVGDLNAAEKDISGLKSGKELEYLEGLFTRALQRQEASERRIAQAMFHR